MPTSRRLPACLLFAGLAAVGCGSTKASLDVNPAYDPAKPRRVAVLPLPGRFTVSDDRVNNGRPDISRGNGLVAGEAAENHLALVGSYTVIPNAPVMRALDGHPPDDAADLPARVFREAREAGVDLMVTVAEEITQTTRAIPINDPNDGGGLMLGGGLGGGRGGFGRAGVLGPVFPAPAREQRFTYRTDLEVKMHLIGWDTETGRQVWSARSTGKVGLLDDDGIEPRRTAAIKAIAEALAKHHLQHRRPSAPAKPETSP
jgi:hypothetical protein